MKYVKNYLWVMLISCSPGAFAQVATIHVGDNSGAVFVREVKLIDDFIERFNDDSNSHIRQQCKELYGSDSIINRSKLLQSLFNRQDKGSGAGPFLQSVLGGTQPLHLSFTDSNWYAEVNCVFLYNHKKIEVPLLLHINTTQATSKWMIAGIVTAQLPEVIPDSSVTAGETSGAFIPTSAYGTDFITFNTTLTSDMHAADYFEPQLLSCQKTQAFIQLIRQKKLLFQRVSRTKYYFFQVPGWVFTVEQFKRKDTNCGWLISDLQQFTPPEKEAFLKLLLYP